MNHSINNIVSKVSLLSTPKRFWEGVCSKYHSPKTEIIFVLIQHLSIKL